MNILLIFFKHVWGFCYYAHNMVLGNSMYPQGFLNEKINLKDIHREKAPSNKTPTLTKSMNMDIWVVGASNRLFLRGS